MSKYIIDIPDSVKKIVYFHVGNANAIWTTSNILDDLEELNSDYINEHFGDLQDTAYKKGLHDGESKCGYCNEYQRGLDDAWEAARRISMLESDGGYSWKEMKSIFGTDNASEIYVLHTATEAINKIKAYEEKQKADDEIKVGDEVEISQSDANGIWVVIKVEKHDGYEAYCAINKDGDIYFEEEQDRVTKTGRHFDIASILEAMKA